MLQIIVGMFVAAWLVVSVVSWHDESTLQTQRNTEQGRLLVELEATKIPGASQLVDEWRKEYPQPSEQRLMELRVLVERVKADPAGAEKYTAAAKQAKLDALPFSSPFFGTPTAKPGIE
ncbi:hypothetical protein [Denitromonas sp.]|uniref:hypothetical protein n=1 Tax=Denitromonas sp. TaxID=2734609 RepID=UPI002AFDF048|nr:hypothetical protein [Denitromonas sp.]